MDVRSRRPRMLISAATNWLAFAATLAVSFFLTPFLLRTLGTDRYGNFCVVESILAYFTLLDLGIAACVVRYVARHHAIGERLELNRLISSSLAIFLGAATFALVVGTVVLAIASQRLQESVDHAEPLFPFMWLMLLNLALTLPLSVFPSILDGLEQFTAKSGLRLLLLAVRTWAIVHYAEQGLFPLAVVYLITNLTEHLLMAALCFRFLPGLSLHVRHVNRETLHTVRHYSVDAFLAMLAGRITLQTGPILIGFLMPSGLVAVFVTALRLVEYAKTLLRTITTTLTPGVSAMEARGDEEGIRRLFLNATRWVLYAVIPVNLGLWFFGKPFLIRWVPSIGEQAFASLTILAFTLSVGVAQSVASRMLYGLGKLKLFARLAIGEAICNLLLTFVLIRTAGMEGVALAVAIPNVIFCVLVIYYTLTILQVRLRKYLGSWIAPVICSVSLVVFWSQWGPVEANWLAIFTPIASGLGIYALLAGGVELWTARSRKANRPTPDVRQESVRFSACLPESATSASPQSVPSTGPVCEPQQSPP